MYDSIWDSISPYQQATDLAHVLEAEDDLTKLQILVDLGHVLDIPIVILDEDDPDLSRRLLIPRCQGSCRMFLAPF